MSMANIMMKKELTSEQLLMVESELERRKKSKGVMYLLWFFLGGIGGHRYYLGDTGRAILMTFTFGCFGILTLIDLFLIGNRLEEKTAQLELEIIQRVKAVS